MLPWLPSSPAQEGRGAVSACARLCGLQPAAILTHVHAGLPGSCAMQITCVPPTSPPACSSTRGPACPPQTCAALRTWWLGTQVIRKWQVRDGWRSLDTTPCSALVGGAGGGPPDYCNWYGLSCCTAAGAADGTCLALHSMDIMDIRVNSVNGSISDPANLGALLQLYACGMRWAPVRARRAGAARQAGGGGHPTACGHTGACVCCAAAHAPTPFVAAGSSTWRAMPSAAAFPLSLGA